jgi:hypothetical protein
LLIVPSAQAQLKPEAIFPDSTKGYFSISSMAEFSKTWQKTELGQMLLDPIMKPFEEELRTRIEEKWLSKLGLSFSEIASFPKGSLNGGLVAVPGKTPGVIVAVELNQESQGEEVLDYIKKIGSKLEAQGAKKSTGILNEGALKINTNLYTFPPAEGSQITPTIIYLVTQNFLVITDQNDLARMMVGRLNGKSADTLESKPAYQAVMKRVTESDTESRTHLLRWYIEPLEFAAAIQLMVESPKPEHKSQVNIYDFLVKHGLNEVQGVGGVLDMASEDYQVIYKTFFYAPPPRKGAIMKMLSFPNQIEGTLPGWVPKTAARLSVFSANIHDIFENIGPLFNDIAQETAGVWEDVLEGYKSDPLGPQLDIKKDFIAHLNNRVFLLINYKQPFTENSEQYVIAVELKEGKEEAVKASLQKFFGDDRDVLKTEQDGYVFWQIKPASMKAEERASVKQDSIVPKRNVPSRSAEETEEEPDLFPNGAVTVGNGFIFVSNQKDYLLEVLKNKAESSEIESEDSYKMIQDVITETEADVSNGFVKVFSRSADVTKPVYEMFRNKEVPRSKTLIAWFLNSIMVSTDEDGEKIISLDTGKMPEFEKIRHYFGSGGMLGITEENGWYLQGFQIKK